MGGGVADGSIDNGSASSEEVQRSIKTAMPSHALLSRRCGLRRVLIAFTIAATAVVAVSPAIAGAAVTTFGSPLSQPATLDTTNNLGYYGTYTPVPPSPQAPNGLYHTAHYGADTALWNATLANGQAGAPATGQAVKVSLEGCAQPAKGGPRPLTQMHFQDLSPLPDGGAKVNLTSQAFDIPVCGEAGASGSTVTSYEPINLCVAQGDYVAFNDEGGYVPYTYQAGVPYQVIGRTAGSTMDSFIRGNGTNNGSTLSAHYTSANDGFVANQNEELMLQVTLGTGPDATHICAGGTGGLAPALPAMRVSPQTAGVSHSKVITVAVYCRPVSGCRGLATLTSAEELSRYGTSVAPTVYGHAKFFLRGNKTGHLPIRINSRLMALVRKHHGARVLLSLAMGGKAFNQTITVKIL
jgi:hypothetical protein